MKAVKARRRRKTARRKKSATRRKAASGRKTRVLSTSEARANFAGALENAHADNAIIGFDRYGQTVAALVPVEAIYMLAGMNRVVPAATRKEIAAGAALFARNVPYGPVKGAGRSQKSTPRKSKAKTARRRAKRA